MTTLTIEAIYQNGVLKPTVTLDLPDNTPVTLTVSSAPVISIGKSPFATLRGIWVDVPFPASLEVALQQIRAFTNTKLEQLAKDLVNG